MELIFDYMHNQFPHTCIANTRTNTLAHTNDLYAEVAWASTVMLIRVSPSGRLPRYVYHIHTHMMQRGRETD